MFKIFISLLLLIKSILAQPQATAFLFICTTPQYTLLCNLTIEAGLDSALNDPNADITLFAPNNDVLSEIEDGIQNDAQLRELLEYHVIPARRESFSFFDFEVIPMLNNRNVTVNIRPTIPEVIDDAGNAVPIIDLDNPVTNGFVHGIAGVLIPDTVNITSSPNITTTALPPSNITTTDVPSNITTTDVPANITTTDIPSNITTTNIPSNITTTDVPANITTTDAPANITTTATPINTTVAPEPSSAPTSTPSLAPTPIPLSEINRMAIEELELRVTALERQLSECNCKKDDSIDKGYKGGKGFGSKRRPSFSRRSSRRFSKFSRRGW